MGGLWAAANRWDVGFGRDYSNCASYSWQESMVHNKTADSEYW